MATDITKTGPQNYKSLQKQNQQVFNPSTATDEDWYRYIKRRGINSFNNEPTQYVGIQAAEAGYGDSQYDDAVSNVNQLGDLNDIRYQEQPWYDVLANGVGKMLGTAGTTFISSLIGVPYGITQAISQNRASAIWDNELTRGLSKVDEWLENNMTNYQSQAQQQDPTFRLGDMNWWADNVIKNMGFTIGAAASMAVGSGALGLMGKAMGLTSKLGTGSKMTSNFLSALFSATGEGMIEAKQGVDERNKLEFQRLEDALAPEEEAIKQEFNAINQEYQANANQTLMFDREGNSYDPAYEKYKKQMSELQIKRDNLKRKKEAGRQQIVESGQEMGNAILGLNQALLTAGNLIQFGKGISKSFERAAHTANQSSKIAKPLGVTATRGADGLYKIKGKTLGKVASLLKNPITEGSEEMNQQWIQSGAGAAYEEKDANDYWKAKLNPKAYNNTSTGLYTLGNVISEGFKDSWGDKDQYEQFLVGAMTGAMGMVTPSKVFNQDKTKSKWNPSRYFSWEGGAVNDVKDFNEEYGKYEQNINDINSILQQESFPSRVSSLVAHSYLESEKEEALNNDDKKAWKDADAKQNIHDIQAFIRAGKLDDLRAIYNEMNENLDDEGIQSIVKSTTKKISADEDKLENDNREDAIIAEKYKSIEDLNNQINNIEQQGDYIEDSEEKENYYNSVADTLNKYTEKINKLQDEIREHENAKESYIGKESYSGAYVDTEGNQVVSNDKIREDVKHNSEELNRKLDSYLESIRIVNEMTKGKLTKDQEDNLAYLHNISTDKTERVDKIMANVRKQLPSKFLLKTEKSPEELSKQFASSDLAFTKDENTKKGYVEVDTSVMNDKAFGTFFIDNIIGGQNIVAKNEKETNENKEEQLRVNEDLIKEAFINNAIQKNGLNLQETTASKDYENLINDINDAVKLYSEAYQFYNTYLDYMLNPSKVDEAKEKEEKKAEKNNVEQQLKSKFAGKTAQQFNQGIADGSIDIDDIDGFADINLNDITDEDVKAAQTEAKKSQNIRQKQSAIKKHIQDQIVENPTQEELNRAQIAMQMVDYAALNAENADDINIDMPELNQIPIDQIDPNASIDDVDILSQNIQSMLADAFNAVQEDINAQNDIPEEVPGTINDVKAPAPTETGHDPINKIDPIVVPPSPAASKNSSDNDLKSIPINSLGEGAIDKIIDETKKITKANTNGTWRSNTTLHPYGKSSGTYHEDIAKFQFGEQSLEYKRSKAIWDVLNESGSFNAVDNVSKDRIKEGDIIHFIVAYLPILETSFNETSEENKHKATVIFMANDKGEILGDLPLAEFEPSFIAGNPTQQVRELKAFQDKIFNSFYEYYAKTGEYLAVVDSNLKLEGVGNLNLTFNNAKKTPLISKVKQVMRGVVPYSKTEKHTLNEVAAGESMQLGVKVTGTTIATSRKNKASQGEFVIPNVGTIGQPYLMMPTPSGEKIAVPFYTKPFNAQQYKDSEMYKLLCNAIYYILEHNDNSLLSKEYFKKHTDVIEGLLQVKAQEGQKVISITPSSITLHLQSLADPSQKYNFTIPNTHNNTQNAVELVNQISNIPINVSLEYLNNTIETGLTESEKYKVDYNKVIGEIADVNLPENTTHTVNSWFTIELVSDAKLSNTREVKPKLTGIITETINGRNVEINTDNYTAVDTTTGEIIEDDEYVNLRLAQIKASKPIYKDKDFIQITINGETRTYDVKNNRFVKGAPINKEAASSIIMPSYFSSMREQIGDKKSSLDYYLKDAEYNTSKGHVAGGPAFQGTLQPAIRFAIDSGILSKDFEDVASGSSVPYERLTAAVQALKNKGINSPKELINVVEIGVLPKASASSEAVTLKDQSTSNSIIEIDVPTTTGGTRKERVQKVSFEELKKGDVIWYSGPETEKPISQGKIIAIENDDIYLENGRMGAVKAIYKVVPTNTTVSFVEPQAQRSYINTLVSWAEGKISREEAIKQLDGTEYIKTKDPNPLLHTAGGTYFTNKVEIELGKYVHEKYPFLTTDNVKVSTGVSTFGGGMGLIIVRDPEGNEYGTPSNFLHSLATGGERSTSVVAKYTTASPSLKSLEQIESEMKQNKTVTRKNKDAWAAIPNDLKLKLVNEGASLTLTYKGSDYTIKLSDRPNLIKVLNDANIAAKAGNMKVSEAAKPMKKKGITLSREKEREARKWLTKNLPSLSSEERTQFVEKIARAGENGDKIWGSYRAGVIEILKNAPMGTIYHEAFHYVLDIVLSSGERQEILNIAKEEYKLSNNYAAEERLANDFRRYAMDENATGILGKIKRWFRKISDRITRYNRISDATINQLFWKINNGELAQKSQTIESFEETQQQVLREIRNVQKKKTAWNNLNKETKKALKDSGLSEAAYNEMSLEEKMQYLKCRA